MKKNDTMIITNIRIVLLILALAQPVLAENVFLAVDGSDRNMGDMKAPFASLKKALSGMQPGDTCFVREGNYHFENQLKNIEGSKDKPLVVLAYPDEKVVFDGTIDVKGRWKKT